MGEQSKGSPTAAELRCRAEATARLARRGTPIECAYYGSEAAAWKAGAAAMERAERLEAALRGFMALVNNGLGPRIDGPKEHMEAWDAAKAALAQEGGA